MALTIIIHKKGDISDLENYRTISLISHLYKWFMKIITGFRKEFGTNDHLLVLKTLIEKSIEYNKPLNLLLIDFQKAFDTVDLSAIITALEECRIDSKYTNLIKHIYDNVTASVRLYNKIIIERGIRQGDTISPKLFTAALEHAFKPLNWGKKV